MGAAGDDDDHDAGGRDAARLDRWLWFVRVVKSRTLAAGLVGQGKVRINRAKAVKPSQMVRIGDVLTVTVGPRVRILKVVAFGERRGPPSEAQMLYEELSAAAPPSGQTVQAAEGRSPGSGRPTKRDRREMDRFKGG
jgi:ribosome-associated heat shock protein Hsp15